MPGLAPPRLRGGLPWIGHMVAYGRDPSRFIDSVTARHDEIASFVLFGQRVVMLAGARASAWFYRATDDQLDPAPAYGVMTPIFGRGVLYDAPPARRRDQLAMLMPALRGTAIRGHVPKILAEVRDSTRHWRASGQFDAVDFMQQLTINTASHCLLGAAFRSAVNDEFSRLYADLEAAINPLAYYFPDLPLPTFRRRDAARRRLQELIDAAVAERRSGRVREYDLLQTLVDAHYQDGAALSRTEIAGILIGVIFAGHHTSSGTAAWLLVELLRNPQVMALVQAEVDDAEQITAESVHQMRVLDASLREVLRLHPPLLILMRKALTDLQFGPYTIPAGDLVWNSPVTTHRSETLFARPDRFDPERFSVGRGTDKQVGAYQPFGGGVHRCAGSGFAALQIKVIIADLLRRYEFALAGRPADYVDDHTQMIIQPRMPCPISYRPRHSAQ